MGGGRSHVDAALGSLLWSIVTLVDGLDIRSKQNLALLVVVIGSLLNDSPGGVLLADASDWFQDSHERFVTPGFALKNVRPSPRWIGRKTIGGDESPCSHSSMHNIV